MMNLNNESMKSYSFLQDMYRDDYFPNFLVDKIKALLVSLCEDIERTKPSTDESLLILTHATTEKINDLEEEFDENDSELETGARESMAEDFEFIVRTYGFKDIDLEDVIAPRDW